MESVFVNKRFSRSIVRGILAICISVISVCCISARDFVITLDAGHGGKDYGAIGKITNEKSITLSVVRQLGALIEKNLPDVKVVYTRSNDVFIPLAQRAEISNHAGSDLFMSVHVNSVDKRNKRRTTIEGCQVYTLGLHKSAENLAVAKRENAVMELEADHTTKYAGFDPNSLESDIIFELSQSKRLDQSIEFADAIHSQLSSIAGRAPKGVRQAGFWVLWATSAPSVLVELDFICNPKSEIFLHSESGQEKMVAALYNAFCSYLNTYGSGIVGRALPPAKLITPEGVTNVPYTSNSNLLTPNTDNLTGNSAASNIVNENMENREKSNSRIMPVVDSDQTVYYIQLLASSTPLNDTDSRLHGFESLEVYTENGLYKYVLGPTESLKDAKKLQKEVRKYFPECFIITMEHGKRTGFIKP